MLQIAVFIYCKFIYYLLILYLYYYLFISKLLYWLFEFVI